MKRVLVVLVLLAAVPGLLFATDAGMAVATVTISFFSLGLGLVGVAQKNAPAAWVIGGFQIAIGVLGIVLLATGSLGAGDLLAAIKEQVK